MTLMEELKSRNFSIYGQWAGLITAVVCFACGLADFFYLISFIVVFAIICFVSSFLILFIEVPFLLRICPTSEKFDTFIRRFQTNWMRAVIYLILSVVQWLSLLAGRSTLIAAAVCLIITSIFYALAAVKGQGFIGSKTLGGQGVAQMIV